MLVKFEQVGRPAAIWINPDNVIWLRHKSTSRYDGDRYDGEVIVDGITEICLGSEVIHVPNTPEEVVAKLFSGQQARLMKEQWERVADSLASKSGLCTL